MRICQMQLTENKLYRKCQAANFKKSRNLPKARALPWRVKSFCCPSLCNRKMQMQLRKSIKTTLFEDFALLRLPGPEHSLATIQFRAARGCFLSFTRDELTYEISAQAAQPKWNFRRLKLAKYAAQNSRRFNSRQYS